MLYTYDSRTCSVQLYTYEDNIFENRIPSTYLLTSYDTKVRKYYVYNVVQIL